LETSEKGAVTFREAGSQVLALLFHGGVDGATTDNSLAAAVAARIGFLRPLAQSFLADRAFFASAP